MTLQKRWLVAALGVAAVLLAVWGVTRSGSGGVTRPNVVLIIGCTVRRDQLGMYGGPPEVTPFLTEHAESGAVFEHGVTAATWTKAGTTALFTGQHPAEVGMVDPSPGRSRRKLSDPVLTLAEHFSGQGYQTFGATANPNLNRVFGFAQGFDDYVEGTNLWRAQSEAKVPGRALVDKAIKVLSASRDDRPLFASILFTDAHAPADPTPEELARVPPSEVPQQVRAYQAMLTRFDAAVAHWVDQLGGLGVLPENTIFVVVNDHGEGLSHPRHHGMGHGPLTYPSVTRMPWILWGANVSPGRIGGVASQVDVFPTLSGLAGLPAPEVKGLDWSAQVRGEAPSTTRDQAEVDTWFQTARRSAVFTTEAHCHANAESKGQAPCFSDERAERRVVASDLARRTQDFLIDMKVAYHRFRHTEDAAADWKVQEQLEALGYVDGGDGTVP